MTQRWRVGLVLMAIGGGLATCVVLFNWPTALLAAPLTVHERVQSADVIIVLGAGARRQGDPLPPQAKERVLTGISLWRQGLAPRLLVAGGLSRIGGHVEAELMADFAEGQGVPPEQITLEDQSGDTWENAVNSLAIMERQGWRTALVVTSSYHTFRACAIFRKLKAVVRCLPAPLNTIPTDTVYERLTDFRSVVREYGAIVYFVFKHYI